MVFGFCGDSLFYGFRASSLPTIPCCKLTKLKRTGICHEWMGHIALNFQRVSCKCSTPCLPSLQSFLGFREQDTLFFAKVQDSQLLEAVGLQGSIVHLLPGTIPELPCSLNLALNPEGRPSLLPSLKLKCLQKLHSNRIRSRLWHACQPAKRLGGKKSALGSPSLRGPKLRAGGAPDPKP